MCWINQINHKVDNSKGRGRREKMSIPFLYKLKLAQKSTRTDDSCETQQKNILMSMLLCEKPSNNFWIDGIVSIRQFIWW